MKVAIMGAGLAGLSCALTLEKYGISPTVFESRSQVGDRFVNSEIILSALCRPHRDPLAYLADTYGIFLHPVGHISELLLFSEHEKAVVKGQLGFSTIRGREADSWEKQLARQVKSDIVFNSRHAYEDLLEEYTHVVVATGDGAYAEKMQNYHTDLTVTIKGATLEGSFNRYAVAAWLDARYAPLGYSYFIPYSEHEANLSVAFPDYPQNENVDADQLWHHLHETVRRDLGQELKITDTFSITGYAIGLCNYPRLGNTFFTGNCFGAIMPFLGFGQYPAILTGIYAALDLCGKGRYEDLTRPLRKSYQNALSLRSSLEKLDNKGLDLVVKALNTKAAERLFHSRFDFLKGAGLLLRALPEQ
ncbi:NAD(P)/FAD-dependent oxidoreductase [Dethiobacter alkaliphilus]|uniref:NAD(P)/FAD-dependent oxidoreductase n=1 Tax=Dethiobacter alkaliphilus TaxID=427926 RepID=UPI002226882B|nr:NAD(P)/FAD-dependent oxidoreductase [Dethiobacter alkaliphilus]MCW3488915.1 NAD(P)/FAD-dependent oxidoreductase [Dethiobacter alkaliphilus]